MTHNYNPAAFITHTTDKKAFKILLLLLLMTYDIIAKIGTSDQSCWLAEAFKIPSLDGLWIHGVTVPNAPLTVITVHGCGNMPGHMTDGVSWHLCSSHHDGDKK